MPLTRRNVSPAYVNREPLPPEVQRDELQCVANRTISNFIRQLASLSKHAEHIFGEIYHDAMVLDHKTNTLSQRVDRLGERLIQLDSLTHDGSLDDMQMKKAFKSSCFVDQHVLKRETLPAALHEQYDKCCAPPNLDALNPFRESAEPALSLYTNPDFFFDLWRSEMLKECGEVRRPVDKRRSPRKQRQKVEEGTNNKAHANRLLHSLRPDPLAFPDEYQTPASLGIQRRGDWQQIPSTANMPLMNAPSGMRRVVASQEPSHNRIIEADPSSLRSLPPSSLPPIHHKHHLNDIPPNVGLLSIDEEDDGLPPPPTQLMTASTLIPPAASEAPIQLVETAPVAVPVEVGCDVPPSSIPPPPPPPPQAAAAVASFAGGDAQTSRVGDARSDLLAQIQAGCKLKKVRLEEEAAAEREASKTNDVAAILKRRMEHVYGVDESSEEEENDDAQWADDD